MPKHLRVIYHGKTSPSRMKHLECLIKTQEEITRTEFCSQAIGCIQISRVLREKFYASAPRFDIWIARLSRKIPSASRNTPRPKSIINIYTSIPPDWRWWQQHCVFSTGFSQPGAQRGYARFAPRCLAVCPDSRVFVQHFPPWWHRFDNASPSDNYIFENEKRRQRWDLTSYRSPL